MNTQLLEDAFTEPEKTIAGLKLRPFSIGSLNICRRLNLTLFTQAEGAAELSEEEKQRQIVAFLFIQSEPLPDVLKAIRSENFDDEYLLPFSCRLPISAIPEAVKEIQRIIDAAGAAAVEVEPKPGEKTSDAPPNS